MDRDLNIQGAQQLGFHDAEHLEYWDLKTLSDRNTVKLEQNCACF